MAASATQNNTNNLPLRFKEGLYRPLAYVRVKVEPSFGASASSGVAGSVPPAPPALTAPPKEFNITLEKAVVELCSKAEAESQALLAAAESYKSVSDGFKAATSPQRDPKRQRTGPSPQSATRQANNAGADSDEEEEPTVSHPGATMAVKNGGSGSSSSSAAPASAAGATGARSSGTSAAAGIASVASSLAGNVMAKVTSFTMASSSVTVNPPLPKPWSCSVCTYRNTPTSQKCAMCENERPADASSSVASPANATSKYSSIGSGSNAAALAGSSSSSSAASSEANNPFGVGGKKASFNTATTWYCSLCAAANAPSATRCHICSAQKQAGGSGV